MVRDNKLIQKAEDFVKQAFEGIEGRLLIAHDFQHVDRVRNSALVIAKHEGYTELEKLEVAALLHDIGLTQMSEGIERTEHGAIGAEMAEEYLKSNSSLNTSDINQISDAIKYHSIAPLIVNEYLQTLGERGKLLEIIRDADGIDSCGAIGLMRAFSSKYFLQAYNPSDIKGDAWALTLEERLEKFRKERPPVNTIIDQVNQQIRVYENLHTETARNMAAPLIQFMKNFVLQLENEISFTEQRPLRINSI